MKPTGIIPTAAAALLAALLARPAAGQFTGRAAEPWRTVETEHFLFHFPAPLADWALPVAARFEAVRGAVTAIVGSAPSQRVTVVMDDPITISNGIAMADLNAPVILFLATPPGPRSHIGDSRDWGELLTVHEYAHIAHMARPSRSPRHRLIGWLTGLGPIAGRSPRWVTEGYATFVEGRLTGSGRPHGAWRAAVLRQWALEGRLPSYGRLNAVDGYEGGAFAYLAGSAYLEWLAAQKGDSSLVHLWRRLTARKTRSFADAFRGVYGDGPADRYGRFQAEVTASAMELERRLKAAGLVEGETVQKLSWYTGDPALSRDGSRMAIVLRSEEGPSRVVVWNTAPSPAEVADSAKAVERVRRDLEKDPEDVADLRPHPRPKKPLAVLYPAAGGRSHDQPRFLPDGKQVLLVRDEPGSDGSLRPDLFVWNYETGDVRRVTHGAAIVSADPMPDGRTAIAQRCLWGKCGLVRVDLETGQIGTVAEGSPQVNYDRPRVSPDGRSIAAAVQRDGHWRTVVLGADGSGERTIGPDDGAERYDATFLPDGSGLVLVSEAGGIPNLERVDLGTGAAAIVTRVTGAATAPEPSLNGDVYFLRLHARGQDLARVPVGRSVLPLVALDPAEAPAVSPPVVAADTFARQALEAPRGYGLGNRQYRFIPALGIGRGGVIGTLALASTDPVGRLTWLLQGSRLGEADWSGGSARVSLRRWTPLELSGELFGAEEQPAFRDPAVRPGDWLRYRGGGLGVTLERSTGAFGAEVRAGGATGRLSPEGGADRTRTLGYGGLDVVALGAIGGLLDLSARLAVDGSAGETAGGTWRRGVASGGLVVSQRASPGYGVELQGVYGEVRGQGGPFEDFLVGGTRSSLFDPAILTQRRQMPALPIGILAGRRVTEVKARLTGLALAPYIWAADTDRYRGGWVRVVGAEQELDIDPIPLFRLPGTYVILGIGYSLDEQPRQWRFYASSILRP